MRVVLTAFILMITSSVASASCNLTQIVNTRGLFFNLGAFVTTGPSGFNILSCQLGKGFYAETFIITPFQDFDNGKELDGRLGWVKTINGFQFDASIAFYRYSFATPAIVYGTDLDLRLKVSHDLKVDKVSTVTPFAGIDLKRSITANADDHSVFGGVSWQVKLADNLSWNTSVSLWHHVDSPLPNFEANVYSLITGPNLRLNENLSLGLNYVGTKGGLQSQGDYKNALMLVLNIRR